MWVQPLTTAGVQLIPPPQRSEESKVCVLVNANARQVNSKVLKSLSHVVREEDLFLSRAELDARRIAHTVVERRYGTVLCAGGDGTFTAFLNEVLHQVSLRPGRPVPRFGVLKLGTGNSMAELLNASSVRGGGILDDVLRAHAGEVPSYRQLDMLEIQGKLAPFAGLGLDGQLLNDYNWVKSRLGITGHGGYLASVALKTVPHYLTHTTKVECEVINGRDCAAYRLDPQGLPVGEPIAPGETLFRGDLMMAAAATIPYYGYRFKMFPFAGRRRGMMHLRMGCVASAKVLAHLGPMWKGEWFPEGLHDFHAQEVTIRFARPMPLQIAGDAAGYRDELTVSVGREPIEVLDFSTAVV